MEDEASPEDVIKDVRVDTREIEVVTSKDIKTNLVVVIEENHVVVNLTNHQQKETPG